MAEYISELFQATLYKRTQGRKARQTTLIAMLVIAATGAWALRGWLEAEGASTTTVTAVPLVVLGLAAWAAFRLIQFPKFADFLISVEAEMSKVSWPSQSELFKASTVVIVVIFLLAGLLLVYDLVWEAAFGFLLG